MRNPTDYWWDDSGKWQSSATTIAITYAPPTTTAAPARCRYCGMPLIPSSTDATAIAACSQCGAPIGGGDA